MHMVDSEADSVADSGAEDALYAQRSVSVWWGGGEGGRFNCTSNTL